MSPPPPRHAAAFTAIAAYSARMSMLVDVDGGALAVETYPGGSEPILAIHGISSQRKLWMWLHAQDPELQLVAPDLRGRADSVDVAGRSSVRRHAEDMIAVLDAFDLEAVHVCGMSMGGYVAVDLAVRYPDRVQSLILVDGGFPMSLPTALTPAALPAVFADRLDRLRQRWEDVEEYLRFFLAHTGPLLDPADPLLRRYLAHDLDNGQVRLSSDALLSDAEDIFFGENPWQQLDVPVRLSYAQWSSGRNTPPAYPADTIAGWRDRLVSTRFLPDLDHIGSIMTPSGARAAADLIREALG